MTQQGDVLLFQTLNDGDIEIVNGITTMTPGLETMAYLCLFGGNEDDPGQGRSSLTWWGNLDETDENRRYRSRTQHLVQAIPATAANLLRIEEAATRDLDVFLNENIASSVSVSASIPAVDRLNLQIVIEADGQESEFNFTENWKASV